MKGSSTTRVKIISKALTIAGLFLILIGLVCNEWTLAWLFATSATLLPVSRILAWVFDLVLIGLGLSLVCFRKNFQIQINIALLVGALLVSLFIAEGVLRLTYFPEVGRETLHLMVKNPHGTGSYRTKPNLDIVTTVGTKDIVIKTNSHGMRWREVSYDKPPGKERIAFLGDSFTFGCWADSIESSFIGVFESLLDSKKYEVLNFGVCGYGLADEELQIKEEVLLFKPDYIVLMFFNGNDFSDTWLGIDQFDVRGGVAVRRRNVLSSKVPEEYRMPDKDLASRFLDSLSLYRLYAKFQQNLLAGQTDENTAPILDVKADTAPTSDFSVNTAPTLDFKASSHFTSYTFWSRAKYPEVAVNAKNLSLEVLDRIRELCNQNDIRLAIVAIPIKEQVYASQESGENYDINLPQKYIEEYATINSVPYLDLLPELRSYVRKNNVDIYVSGDTHFNNYGHYLVGELVTRLFKEEVLEKDQDFIEKPVFAAKPVAAVPLLWDYLGIAPVFWRR